MRTIDSEPRLAILGNATKYPTDYDPAVLVPIVNKHRERDAWVQLECPEFTSLCPITRQPDFGVIHIRYVPDEFLVESKSLKLYLFSFRNHGDFHEDVVNIICDDLAALLKPRYLEVLGEFRPRGGISIVPFASYDNGDGKFKALAAFRFQRRRL